MNVTSLGRPWLAALVSCLFLVTIPLFALVEPHDDSPLAQLSFQHPGLDIEKSFHTPGQLSLADGDAARGALARLGIAQNGAQIDVRSGRWATLLPTEPLIPGDGVGNRLHWEALGVDTPSDLDTLEGRTWDAFVAYLDTFRHELRIDMAEIPESARVVAHDGGELVQIYVPRMVNGVTVRDAYLSAVISHGNLILFGAHNWGDVEIATTPRLSSDDAASQLASHLGNLRASGSHGKPELILVPMANGLAADQVSLGQGYTYRLAWVIKPSFDGDLGTWEALVDAHSGEVLSFRDKNHYAEIKGGVLPVSNDGIVPDGVEQPGWPMPYIDVVTSGGTVTTDGGGNLSATGSMTSSLAGTFVRMNDNCGAISLTQNDGIDFGASGGTDCTTPGFGGPGNTHASRTGFYELNRIIEMARGQLPGNSWLQQQLTSNMNINNTCNAFWNGSTVNFYRSGGGCFNTGEIAGVFDHEWGHGIDDNDVVPTIASPSGEGIADIYTMLRLNDSCIGRNFRATVCTGFGDPCLTCTGVRDVDYLQRQSGQPHDYSWSNANCGGSVHCVGAVYAEAVWSLWKRILTASPYNMDNNTAHEVVNRLTFLGAGATGTWFSGGPPNGGCAANSGYMNYLAADDDNGNLNDGTPHMGAIFQAFDDQEIACGTPTVQDSGCSGTPTAAPNVSGTPLDKSVSLSWGAVAGTTEYEVFRTDGVFACDFGKVRLGSTTGTSWTDSGLQNGRDYSYVVIPKGAGDSCFGPASACATVAPASGPNADIDTGSAALSITSGDGDQFLDNCETATMNFDVDNTGVGTLTNVRITGVSSPSHPSITFTTSFPAAVSPSTLAQGATGTGSFTFTADGLSFDDTVTFQVGFTADELAIAKSANLTVISAESDFQNFASRTFDFESGTEGWQVIEGTFNRSSAGGGAQGTTWYEASSANLDNQCDHIRSPVISLTSTSTLSLWNQYDIEPQFTNGVWYDRANVGIYDVASGSRTPVNPSGGRQYNASGAQGTCGTAGQQGWADANTTWGESTWTSGALGAAGLAGQPIQLDIRYGTDASLNGFGFRFDQVTLTDFNQQVADGQSNTCGGGCTSNSECDNGLFCDGTETCNLGTGVCEAGTPPDCSDGVGCTVDSCNEATDSCNNAPNDGLCSNGLFCDGTETCDAALGCQAGTPVVCDDGIQCTVDSCNEGADSCAFAPNDSLCDNGLFCDGTETCNAAVGCEAGSDPCSAGQTCDEAGDICIGGSSPVIWMSFRSNTVVPGVGTVADEDIVTYDEGAGTWALLFDGSDVGLGSLEISGLAVLPNGDFLLSFTQAGTVGGIAVDDSDIVQFSPTSLGNTTAGTFSLYFDGSDVNLTSNGEDVDGITLHPDGRLIVSTTGRFTGTGASGADEDLFVFTGTLGSNTSGSFALYFDGSDVALNTNSGEDIDAAALTDGGDLLFSTVGTFAVAGLSGEDEDVAQFSGSFGSSTSGTFNLRLDLTALGIIASEDVGSLHIAE